MVMITTWVASQKLESRTARIISIVSPVGLSDESRLRLWAMTRLPNPTSEPIAEATARRRYFSVKKHKSTAPQPMNRAEEYKLVTGGRPSIHSSRKSEGVREQYDCRENVCCVS